MVRQWAVWRDPAGRFSWLKLAVLLVLLAPGAWLALRYAAGDLGGRPLNQLIRGTGDWTVRFLLASLAVSPLRAVLEWSRAAMLRRMLGVGAACYAVGHVTLYIAEQKWRLGFVITEIVLRIYLTIGFAALLGMMVLAITSTDGWQRRLRQRWKKLHRLIFPIAILALLHYFMQSKADVTDAVFAAGVFVWLGLWRLAPRGWQKRLSLLGGLALVVPLAAALLEALWYGVATGVRAGRVLLANLDPAAMRPSAWLAICAIVLSAIAALRRRGQSR